MSNAFDSTNYPQTEPDTLVQGDRWVWKRTDLTEYPPASYTLSYQVIEESAVTRQHFTITASASGSDHVVEVASATTVGYGAGTYRWAAYITRDSDSERHQVDAGTWRVTPDLASDRADRRTFAQKQIAALQTVLENINARPHENYEIAGRSGTLRNPADIRRELNHWRWVRSSEINTERRGRGHASANNIRTKFRA